MEIFSSLESFYSFRQNLSSQTIAFVPTMGALHEGHLSLVNEAKKNSNVVIVSIFINPLQFSENEDLNEYPVSLDEDLSLLKDLNVQAVLLPKVEEFYVNSRNSLTSVKAAPDLTLEFCARSRPHFFDGVCSVLLRFFQIVKPQIAVFGEKDYQQFCVVKRMCEDFFLPIELKLCPVVRSVTGLALSSRNRYFSKAALKEASFLYGMLKYGAELYHRRFFSFSEILQKMRLYLLENSSFDIEFLEVIDEITLKKMNNFSSNQRFLVAATLQNVRLIDTLSLNDVV